MDVSLPIILEEIVEDSKTLPQKQFSEPICEQIVDAPRPSHLTSVRTVDRVAQNVKSTSKKSHVPVPQS